MTTDDLIAHITTMHTACRTAEPPDTLLALAGTDDMREILIDMYRVGYAHAILELTRYLAQTWKKEASCC